MKIITIILGILWIPFGVIFELAKMFSGGRKR